VRFIASRVRTLVPVANWGFDASMLSVLPVSHPDARIGMTRASVRPFISGGTAKGKEISTEVKRTALLGATGPPEERAAPVHCDIEADSGSYFPA
jgi:hypothetical protein